MDNNKKNHCYASVFHSEAGKIVLQDLNKYVKAQAFDISLSNEALRCVYGQRLLIRYIENCIKNGEKL